MPAFRRRHDPAKISNLVEGRFPLRLIRLCLVELWAALESAGIVDGGGTVVVGGGSGSGGGSGGGGSSLDTQPHEWVANGPYRVDTEVDGGWRVPRDMSITSIGLWRGVAGTSGTTVLDVNRNGSSLYATQANRPKVYAAAGDNATQACPLPDVVTLAEGDWITVDTDEQEAGVPRGWRLTMEAA